MLSTPQDYLFEIENADQQLAYKLTKQATKLLEISKWKDDEEYLKICLRLIDNAGDYNQIQAIFKWMGSNSIGVKFPALYLKWASCECQAGHLDRAQKILKAAIKSNVQPSEEMIRELGRCERSSSDTNSSNYSRDNPVVASSSSKVAVNINLNSSTKPKESERKPLQSRVAQLEDTPTVRGSSSSNLLVQETPSKENNNNNQNLASGGGSNTKSFKFRNSALRGKLGPPARQPVLEAILESHNRTFPSPDSMTSQSPTTSPKLPQSPSRNSQELVESSDDSSSEEEIGKSELQKSIIETVNMDLSNTIFLSHPTPKASAASGISRSILTASNTEANARATESSSSRSRSLSTDSTKNQVYVNGTSYTKTGLIGKGGSCKVFKITDSSGCVFALKKVKLRGQDASVVEGYKNEIILLNKLKSNDRIIHLYDAQHDAKQGLLLMVLEYGELDLEKMLQKEADTPLSINFIRNYWEQMLHAVQAIHDQNIIHSDLKPANFLLVGGCLKLIDFGIAKAIPNDTTNIQRDHQSGTVNYMAPEAINYVEIKGAKQNYLKQGRASDVWSLACILYRFIYTFPPFGKLAFMAKIHAITNPHNQILYPETAYQEVVSLLKQCLVFNPKERLTIPDLLKHSFLGNQKPLDRKLVFDILKLGLQMNVNHSNFKQVAEVICRSIL